MTLRGSSGLRKTSSLVISSPTKSSVPVKKPNKVAVDRDTVPDGEEESGGKFSAYKGDIVELSSESDDDKIKETSIKKKISVVGSDPFLSSSGRPAGSSSKRTTEVIEESETEDDSEEQPHYFPKASKMWRTVVSDSEGELEENKERDDIYRGLADDVDGAILILNDPKSSRRPVARNSDSPVKQKQKKLALASCVDSIPSIPGAELVEVGNPSLAWTPIDPRPYAGPGTQTELPNFFLSEDQPKKASRRAKETNPRKELSSATAPTTSATTKSKTKRRTKKVLQQEKQAQLAAYAQALFDELNKSVFMNRLAKDTPLIWNNRLLATAGRAKWHRDSKGVVTTYIELATKVLDCEERIRNTLSHEMCHLACWVINCNPKENHGGVWRGWVEEVMLKRPDIFITTKHSYDISYKYEWQCQTPTCKKIYGRFSKSINPAESICGACKVGELIPLFQVRTRKTNVVSKLAASNSRDSPVTGSPRLARNLRFTPSCVKTTIDDGVILITSSSDSDRESLSGAETDTDCPAGVPKPKSTLLTIQSESPQLDVGKGKDDLRTLITHMSYIDLTSD
ncbi:hypothetical protein ACEPAG_1079 [Sanghuangporus baumii]